MTSGVFSKWTYTHQRMCISCSLMNPHDGILPFFYVCTYHIHIHKNGGKTNFQYEQRSKRKNKWIGYTWSNSDCLWEHKMWCFAFDFVYIGSKHPQPRLYGGISWSSIYALMVKWDSSTVKSSDWDIHGIIDNYVRIWILMNAYSHCLEATLSGENGCMNSFHFSSQLTVTTFDICVDYILVILHMALKWYNNYYTQLSKYEIMVPNDQKWNNLWINENHYH